MNESFKLVVGISNIGEYCPPPSLYALEQIGLTIDNVMVEAIYLILTEGVIPELAFPLCSNIDLSDVPDILDAYWLGFPQNKLNLTVQIVENIMVEVVYALYSCLYHQILPLRMWAFNDLPPSMHKEHVLECVSIRVEPLVPMDTYMVNASSVMSKVHRTNVSASRHLVVEGPNGTVGYLRPTLGYGGALVGTQASQQECLGSTDFNVTGDEGV